ncbi:uncharacterized protein LOC117299466 [Asterias rubens]|uniref:uncharacterized protein LOC117299466 n=1 Tax=Asterias rubens TaxID=7604 RepID=UPI000FECDC1F|nr:uncharacterized protein LOC117299466 [Asterias rubens]XP_033638896.1 uncharacterized protein LOC117299466 [Asterias rubens]
MKAFIAIVFIAAFIDFGNAISCYECAGTGSSACGDPFSGSSSVEKTDCSSSILYDDMCWKATTSSGLISRSCSAFGICSLVGNGCETGGGESVCCCSGNLCNSASTTGISYVTFASLIIASFLGMM